MIDGVIPFVTSLAGMDIMSTATVLDARIGRYVARISYATLSPM